MPSTGRLPQPTPTTVLAPRSPPRPRRTTSNKNKMGSRYEVEVIVGSARDLKNVNWRNGDLKPYAVLWIDDGARCSTRVDLEDGTGENPSWGEKVVVPLPPASRLEDAVLYIDVVHANAAEGVKPLVGSARLPLRDVLDDAGIGGKLSKSLKLKRPSGRPQGKLDVRVAVREPSRYYDPNPGGYPAPAGPYDPYGGYGAAAGAGGYGAYRSTAPPPQATAPYGSVPPPYGAALPPQAAAQPTQAGYGSELDHTGGKEKKGMGMGAGLAMGAAAGVLGGLALAGGASYVEDKIEDKIEEEVEERVEEELEDRLAEDGGGGYDDYRGGSGGGYDDYGGDDQ